ncbi:MAG: type II secretion system F family protein [Lachnospiraceae bacterium]|nr:type II secretion system F family protein [Lachnospiraceae bacterium]
MPQYTYIAVTPQGKEKKGKIDASDEAKAKAILKKDGMVLLSLSEASMLEKDINITIGNPVKARDLGVFCRQFQSILNAGVTIIEALRMLGEQTENKAFAKAILETAAHVGKGETLADAMRQNPKIFPAILINMVEAGEASGSMDTSFARMATHFEKTAKTQAMIRKAMIYPVVLMLVAVVVVIIMSVVVFPKFSTMFESMGSELPGITKMVMGLSDFLVESWYILLLVVVLLVVVLKVFQTTPAGKHVFGWLAMKAPVFGKMNVKSASANFARTLSTLVSSGMSISEALEITARSMGNIWYQEALEKAKLEVEQGVGLSVALKACELFPPMVYQMLNIGESTGNVETMLDKVAEYYEEEVEMQTQGLSAAMEPMIIVVMGVIVAVLVLAMYMPMIQMYGDAGNL